MSSLLEDEFPKVYANRDSRPLIVDTRDPERHSLPTPSYGFGWVVPRTELYEALFHEESNPSTFLDLFVHTVGGQFQSKWINEGLDKNSYNPDTPGVVDAGDYHLFIYMACNDSDEVMDSIMADHRYHEEVRKCLANSETLKLHPAWLRWDVKGMPMGFKPDTRSEALNPSPDSRDKVLSENSQHNTLVPESTVAQGSQAHPSNTLSFSLAPRSLTLGPITLTMGPVHLGVRLNNIIGRFG